MHALDDGAAAFGHDRIGSEACEPVCVGVPRVEDGPEAARRLVGVGVQVIELCGASAGGGLAAVVASVKDSGA